MECNLLARQSRLKYFINYCIQLYLFRVYFDLLLCPVCTTGSYLPRLEMRPKSANFLKSGLPYSLISSGRNSFEDPHFERYKIKHHPKIVVSYNLINWNL